MMEEPDAPVESQTHFALRVAASVLALDALICALAALACTVFGAALTLGNFSTALFFCGLLFILFGAFNGQNMYSRGLGSLAAWYESRIPDWYRHRADFSNYSIMIAGTIAVIASIVLPLAF